MAYVAPLSLETGDSLLERLVKDGNMAVEPKYADLHRETKN